MKIELISKVFKGIEKELPTILTVGSIVGVAITSYFTHIATKKCEKIKEENGSKMEYVKAVAPAVLSGVLTMTGIYGINRIHVAKYAALMSMYAYSQNENKTIKNVIEEVSGKEKKDEIVKETSKRTEFFDTNSKRKIKDLVTGRMFEATVTELTDAARKVNSIINEEGSASLNDFYRALGLSEVHCGDQMQWIGGQYEMMELVFGSDLTSSMEPVITIDYDFDSKYLY